MRRFASSIGRAIDVVDIAKLACVETKQLGVDGCAVSFHTPDGRPVIAVDNQLELDDEARLAWLLTGWQDDVLYAEMLARRTPLTEELVDDRMHVLLMPIIEASGVAIGSIRSQRREPVSRELERDLWMLCTVVTVRLADLGIATIPEIGTPARLTRRQRDVAHLATRGLTNDEIGNELGISLNTVKNRLKEVFVRLDVESRVELVAAMRQTPASVDVPRGITRDGSLAITYPGPDRVLVESHRA